MCQDRWGENRHVNCKRKQEILSAWSKKILAYEWKLNGKGYYYRKIYIIIIGKRIRMIRWWWIIEIIKMKLAFELQFECWMSVLLPNFHFVSMLVITR